MAAGHQTPLHNPRLFDNHVAAVRVTRHQVRVADEAGTVFVDQHLPSELHRRCRLAAFVQVEIQPHVQNRLRIKPPLTIEGFSHPYCSSKITAGFVKTTIYLTNPARKRSYLRGAFSKKHARILAPNPPADRH